MYIGVLIDSEYYGDLYYTIKETLTEVKSEMEGIAFDANCSEITWENYFLTENNNKVARGVTDSNDDFWFVTEIFYIEEGGIYLVNWHAYDGVDFDVSEFKCWDDAYKEMEGEYYDMISDIGADKVNECYIDSYSTCIDDDNEWHLMQIVSK